MEFKNLLEVTKYFEDKQRATDYLVRMRWEGSPRCIYCGCEKVYQLKLKNAAWRYKCSKCKQQFSAIKGTIFENSAVPLQKWFAAIYLLLSHKKGISSTQLAKDITVTQSTAWFMLQRIRHAMALGTLEKPLQDTVEIDETYVGGKNSNRHISRQIKGIQGRSVKDKTPVLGMVQRQGELRAQKMTNTKSRSIMPVVKANVKAGTTVMTDEWLGYSRLSDTYDHFYVQHKMREFVQGSIHTNTIEGFWSLLKRGIVGIYHHVSEKHLNRYCDEFSFRYNTRKMKDAERFEHAMGALTSRRLTHKQLIGK
jgi:transposase-like protein